MGYHQRIECKDIPSFQTTRTRNSELWFVNNPELEEAILGYAARYTTRYEVKLYALALEGNHSQKAATFPKANRAHFMRDFNSAIARAVPRYQQNYPGGTLWARRYSTEYLVGPQDLEDYFFYIVLQPVNDGLVNNIKDYPGYNCFEDAINGTARQYKVINWKQYNDARRWDKSVSIDDFTEICTLKYERLPGYEELSQNEYAALMRRKLTERTQKVLQARAGKPCAGAAKLKMVTPGSRPKKPRLVDHGTIDPECYQKTRVGVLQGTPGTSRSISHTKKHRPVTGPDNSMLHSLQEPTNRPFLRSLSAEL
jgi:hypothetical protein